MPVKVVIALLIAASASLLEAQTFQNLCSINFNNGGWPYVPLTLGTDGNFYGTTYSGGTSGFGTVFRVTTSGVLTNLVSFNADGSRSGR